jgi:hypothetical protein
MLKNLPPFFPIFSGGPYYRVSKNQDFHLTPAEGIYNKAVSRAGGQY